MLPMRKVLTRRAVPFRSTSRCSLQAGHGRCRRTDAVLRRFGMDSWVTGNGWHGVHADSTRDSTPSIGGGKAEPGPEPEVEEDHGVPAGAGMGEGRPGLDEPQELEWRRLRRWTLRSDEPQEPRTRTGRGSSSG